MYKKSYETEMEMRGIPFRITTYCEHYTGEYQRGEVSKIQVQLEFVDIYSKSGLDWNYYPKKFIIADIKVNSVHDKLKWSIQTFELFVKRLKYHLSRNELIEHLSQLAGGGSLLGTIYQLDYIKLPETYYGLQERGEIGETWGVVKTKEEAEEYNEKKKEKSN